MSADLAGVLAGLRGEWSTVAARLDQLGKAIAAIEPLVDGGHPDGTPSHARSILTTAPPRDDKKTPPPKPAASAPAKPNGSGPTDDDVRAYLRRYAGGVRPSEFDAHFRLSRAWRTEFVKELVKRGVVVVSGATMAARIALPLAPAKEAP